MRWIFNSLEKPLKESLKYVRSSKELWSKLLERYGQANALEIYQLTKELGAVVHDNLSLVEYYGKLKNLWETLDCLDSLPVCSCCKIDLCTCTLMRRMVERDNNAKLIQFLMNLNSGYDGIRTQVLSMDPLPSIGKVLGLLQKIERQKQITDSVISLTESNAFASFKNNDSKKVGFQNNKPPDSVPKHCDHCNRDMVTLGKLVLVWLNALTATKLATILYIVS
ncbi:uncharacterized protein LOC141588389 [Silene latifolia]|uniref:uncharacterized protein LOC141588389 n=1 Tax=Silene latifolia TaxID=37657 RepID=UPI003D7725E5